MPYNHPNIKYGLPHEEYPREKINECIDSLKEVIDLKREPVGITLLFTKEDYEEYPIEETTVATTYCVMVKQAVVQEKGIKCRL